MPSNIWSYWTYWDRKALANSVDSDQTPQKVASDQCLHFLPLIQQFLYILFKNLRESMLRRKGVPIFMISTVPYGPSESTRWILHILMRLPLDVSRIEIPLRNTHTQQAMSLHNHFNSFTLTKTYTMRKVLTWFIWHIKNKMQVWFTGKKKNHKA